MRLMLSIDGAPPILGDLTSRKGSGNDMGVSYPVWIYKFTPKTGEQLEITADSAIGFPEDEEAAMVTGRLPGYGPYQSWRLTSPGS